MRAALLPSHLVLLCAIAASSAYAHAGHDMDMDMGSDSSSDSSSMMNMHMGIFHSSLGSDTLWFSGWMPTSSGATAGAALGLAALSIFYRFVIAFRATLERSWRLQLTHDRVEVSLGSNGMVVPVLRRGGSPSGSSDELIKDAEAEELPALHRTPKKAFIAARRLAPPFAFSRELTRGVLQAFSSFIGYLLMLAVMTANAYFFIAVVLGLGAGEFLFGRYAVPEDH